MLLKNYTLRIVLAECNPSPEKVNALVEISEEISEVLPYLNTLLKGFQYSDGGKILTVKRKRNLITFRPRQIAVTKLEDEKEAKEVMEELKQIVNETYVKRVELNQVILQYQYPDPQIFTNYFREQTVKSAEYKAVLLSPSNSLVMNSNGHNAPYC